MTVTRISTIRRYVGLSTDTKPSGAPAGSLFRETNTGRVYVSDGAAWSLWTGDAP